jgi:hypothetical protein
MRRIAFLLAGSLACVLGLISCGGGGGDAGSPAVPTGTGGPAAATLDASSGEITAFGSVFVNGHEFSTQGAQVIDNDTGAASTDASALEVGMSVDVKPMAATALAASAPQAAEIRVHPLARGYVDATDATASTLTVMGQTVQLSAATNFSDHRACVSAASSPCAAVSGVSGLVTTSGAASPGSYVTVHGFLFSSGSAGATANIVATLVAVGDAPGSSASPAAFKAEGAVLATGASSVTLGGLAVDLGKARCEAAGATVNCASAFSVGQVVSVFSATSPGLPATSFSATAAALRSRLPVQTAGATVELQGRVSSVSNAAPASFVLRGMTIDASALPAASLPAVGDDVRVTGVVGANGSSISASAVKLLHAVVSRSLDLEGDVSAVAAGAAANTYVVTVLGQNILVDGSTRLSDRSGSGNGHSGSSAFNITTFQSVLAASASKHVVVDAAADGSGQLTALSLRLRPASSSAAIQGVVDASPAPVNGSSASAPSSFAIHGVTVSVDPAMFASPRGGWHLRALSTTVAAGDLVVARGSYVGGQIVVAVPSGSSGPTAGAFVFDLGAPSTRDACEF